MYLVKKINYIDGYKISLTFNNKKTKIVDIEPYLDKGDVFLPLRDIEYFNKVCLSGNTIVWPNEADFCPDVLYEIGVDVPDEAMPAKATPRTRRRKAGEQANVRYQAARALSKKRPKKAP